MYRVGGGLPITRTSVEYDRSSDLAASCPATFIVGVDRIIQRAAPWRQAQCFLSVASTTLSPSWDRLPLGLAGRAEAPACRVYSGFASSLRSIDWAIAS